MNTVPASSTPPVAPLTVALLQMRSGTEAAVNVQTVRQAAASAAHAGARLLITPEMTTVLDRRPGRLMASASAQEDDVSIQAYCELAQQHQLDLLIGSMAVKVAPERLANRSLLISHEGQVVAQYDKIHLFDADLGEGQRYEESARFSAGQQAVVARRADYTLGMTVCYDMRFPALYRDLALAGAQLISVPSSFTVPTGQAHWHVMLRARAIETGCFVLAPAQHGVHADGRETYGHSVVINPWGEVVAERTEGEGLLLARLDLAQIAQARQRLPSLQHARPYHQP
jgi:predicted amidohydrolase